MRGRRGDEEHTAAAIGLLGDLLQVDGEVDTLGGIRHKRSRLDQEGASAREEASDVLHEVTLKLTPVGAGFVLHSDVQLHSLVRSLLATLEAVHRAGFVHRDIRCDNVVKGMHDNWYLIDWELAGRSGVKVWSPGKSLPEEVSMHGGREPYLSKHDLWQVGELIEANYTVACQESREFAKQIKAGKFTSAHSAMLGIWTPLSMCS